MSELTKVRKSVIDHTQLIPDMVGHDGKVLSNNGEITRWVWGRIVGEIARFSFDTPPPGFFALDGSTIPNGANDFPELVSCGSRFVYLEGSNLKLFDCQYFSRGKGASGRSAGSWETDAIRNITGSMANVQSGVSSVIHCSGAFSGNSTATYGNHSGGGAHQFTIDFDASRVVPIAHENRPMSHTELVCIYHGVI